MNRDDQQIPRWLILYQCLAGLCDTTTGLLLVFVPAWTLALMGVKRVPDPPVFAAFIGVFVLAVGVAYIIPLLSAAAPGSGRRWQSIWQSTALIRSLVAAFLFWKLLTGTLEFAWITVAVTDGVLATIQWTGLRRGWLNFANK